MEALFEQRLEELVALAELALADPDPWRGFAGFLEQTCARQAADRGLHEIMHGTTYGQHRVAAARERLGPAIRKLFQRAQAAGVVRADLTPNDVPMLGLMVGSVVKYTREIHPEAWRRYLTILLDGIRANDRPPAPLPAGALNEDQLDEAKQCWRPSQ